MDRKEIEQNIRFILQNRDKWIRISCAALLLGLCTKTLQRAERARLISFYRKSNGYRIIKLNELLNVPILSSGKAAILIDRKSRAVRNWVRMGKIPFSRKRRNSCRYVSLASVLRMRRIT